MKKEGLSSGIYNLNLHRHLEELLGREPRAVQFDFKEFWIQAWDALSITF
jgi:hypothetical protein